jgi:Secretion system C-terminal sorting domain
MKKILFFILLFSALSHTTVNAQKEFWGTNQGVEATTDYGTIFKTNFDGTNKMAMHNFDITNGKFPKGRLLLASNGKLYGTAAAGGIVVPGLEEGAGVLFEYDLILNKYRVVNYFKDAGQPTFIWKPTIGLIETTTNIFYGATSQVVYKLNLNTEVLSLIASIPPTGALYNQPYGEMIKASNGYIYGTTLYSSSNPSQSPYFGTIFRINEITNAYNVPYPFPAGNPELGIVPRGMLVEGMPSKLYGTTISGGIIPGTNFLTTYGVLFEYDILTNTYTKKIDFNPIFPGIYPTPLTDGGNGKLYGLMTYNEGGNPQDPNQHYGSLYEYNIATNIITVLHYFDYPTNPINNSLLKASNGLYYGINNFGVFKFDPLNTTTPVSQVDYWGAPNFTISQTNELIEICRKPSYQEFIVNTFTPTVGTAFTYDVVNTNATTYVWKKGTILLTAQTSGVLNLPNITTNDTGVYTCTMTNECGTTITANLNINVVNLAVETVDDYKTLISLYPNPTKGLLNLKFPENRGLKGIKYKIINFLGQVIVENDIRASNKNELVIDTASFANGVYQVTLVTDKGNWNGKFVKE